ncbi:MAG: UvrD-helicase domain-containing protein [Polyangiales bacterium]
MSELSPQLIPLDAPTLVEASAGTGKTYTITTYFVRAILESDLSPEQILVLTYTKAATAELRARVRERIVLALGLLDFEAEQQDVLQGVLATAVDRFGRTHVEQKLRKALSEMDRAAILTIHGFCQRLLQDFPLEFGIDFDFEVSENVVALNAELATDFWAAELYDAPEWMLRALEEKKVNPRRLTALANVARLPNIELLGPAPHDVEEGDLADWLRFKREANRIWRSDREKVLDILAEDERLNHQKYPKRSVRTKWQVELDAFFAKPGFRIPPPMMPKLASGKMATKRDCEEPKHELFDACGRLWEVHERLIPGLAYAVFTFQEKFIEFVRLQSQTRRDDKAVFTFDDLLTAVYAPFDSANPGGSSFDRNEVARVVSEAYPLALVDEFQDTDSVQYGIFRSIYGKSSAVYVGDPKQAIYAFRGADVYSYLGAAEDVGERKYSLDTNWRSDPGIVRGVNALFSLRNPAFNLSGIEMQEAIPHFEKPRSSFDPAMEIVYLNESVFGGPIATALAPLVANEIGLLLDSKEVLRDRAVEPGDIAVLCRSNEQGIAVAGALRALGIPVSLEGGASVLRTDIAVDLSAVLEATLMPGNVSLIRRALLTPLLGVTPYELSTMDDLHWADWMSLFTAWHETWQSHGVLRFIEDMLRDTSADTRIAARPLGRRALSDLMQIEELLLRGERERRRDPIALMQWFRRLMKDGASDGAVTTDELQRRPDTETGTVKVSTIHKSKGLEYPIVYCPFTAGDAAMHSSDSTMTKFHDEQRQLKIDLGSENLEDHRLQSQEEALSEALRLLYVAVTRAEFRCTVFWGRAKSWQKSALAYLLHGKDKIAAKVDADEMREDVEAFAASTSGAVGWRYPQTEQAARRERQRPNRELSVRPQKRSFAHAPRIASFTSITGHDEKTPGPRATTSLLGASPVLFAELPGGVRTGLLLHSVLENADFQNLGGEDLGRVIERELRAFGFETSLATSVQNDLQLVGATPFTAEPNAPRLLDLPLSRQLRELEFTLSAKRPKLAGLADILERYGSPAAARAYPQQLRALSTQSLQPFLRGFIDLMFEWQGRWYVADYKSNTLPSYGPDALAEAVQREHYLLQAQLYSAAAQRFLKQQVPSYDPDLHWGGALFFFLRGMRGAGEPGAGVFFDRQAGELLEAVDGWLRGGSDAG